MGFVADPEKTHGATHGGDHSESGVTVFQTHLADLVCLSIKPLLKHIELSNFEIIVQL